MNALAASATVNIASDIQSNRTDTFGSGLHIVDINTGGNDLKLNNANWIINGNADTFVIFRVTDGATLISSNGNFVLDGGILSNNVLFILDSDAGEASFNFSNTLFQGFSFWDIGGIGFNIANFSRSRGCGQIVIDQAVFNDVSMTDCAFSFSDRTTPVPEPASLVILGTGLLSLAVVVRRRRKQADELTA